MNQQPEPNIESPSENWRANFLRTTLIAACALGLFALIAAFINAPSPFYRWIYTGVYLLLLGITILPVSFTVRAVALIGLAFGLGFVGLSTTGIWGDSRVFMLGGILLTSLLFTWRSGRIAVAFTIASYLVAGWLILNGVYVITNPRVAAGDLAVWIGQSANVLVIALLTLNGVRLMQDEFNDASEKSQIALEIIKSERYLLEKNIEQRTREIREINSANERRAKMFQAVAQVTRAIITTQNLHELLPQITQVISQQFGFYHAGIFLLDTNKEYAVLSAANSAGGQRMLARGHRLRVGQVGIVGYAAGENKPRIALDTGADAVYFNNPDMPNTRSEMALPLYASGQVIGVLDIQSVEPNAFNREDIEILSTLADQVSVAITNARLHEETQRTLLEADMLYRRDLQAGWKKFTRSKRIAGVHRVGLKTSVYTDLLNLPDATEALRLGSVYQTTDESSQMTVPIKLRGEAVGMLNVKTNETRKWSSDEMDVVAAIVERAALSIENARLLAESRKIAEKERVVGEISAKVSSFTNRDNILQAAVTEIGRALPGSEVTLLLQRDSDKSDAETG